MVRGSCQSVTRMTPPASIDPTFISTRYSAPSPRCFVEQSSHLVMPLKNSGNRSGSEISANTASGSRSTSRDRSILIMGSQERRQNALGGESRERLLHQSGHVVVGLLGDASAAVPLAPLDRPQHLLQDPRRERDVAAE